MSKKKLSLQQRQRIARKQQNLREQALEEVFQGLVVTRSKNQALVETTGMVDSVLCAIRPELKGLVVGDRVCWRPGLHGQGVVESIFPRTSELRRYDRYGHEKILAANVSQMLIVVAPVPEPSLLLIDSYLVAAELFGIRASIIFNKQDLDRDQLFLQMHSLYSSLDYRVIATDKYHPNMQALDEILNAEQSIVVGQSGVGKSTLIQQLLPHLQESIATSPLTNIHQLGQHTTSATYYFHLPKGGSIIDSPGVRAFNLGKVQAPDIVWGFKEFRPYIGQCQFRDCNHQTNSGCALLLALKNQSISPLRYQNYVKLVKNTI